MCEFRQGYPIEREDGVIFMDLASKSPAEVREEASRIFVEGEETTLCKSKGEINVIPINTVI